MERTVAVTAAQLAVMRAEMDARFASAGAQLRLEVPPRQGFSSDEMVDIARDADVLIAGDDQLDTNFFSQCTRLKLVIRWGAGIDSVDVAAAKNRGVTVVNTPGILGTAVAEYTLGLLLLLARTQHEVNASVHSGVWLKPRGTMLRGKTLGIVGYGNVGQAIGALGHAFGMDVAWFDPGVTPTTALTGHCDSVEQVAEQADYLVLACPLNQSTRGLANRDLLQLMKPSARLVNVARGEVVDEMALAEALVEGSIAGAALDVFHTEPLPQEHALRGLPNVIFGSHNASNTEESVMAVNERAIQLAVEGLAGELLSSKE